MNDPQVIAAMPIDVQLAITEADRQIDYATNKSELVGRTQVVLSFRQYKAMRDYMYGAAEKTR